MKRPSLCSHLCAATLFLSSGLRAEEAKATAVEPAAGAMVTSAEKGPDAAADLAAKRRAAAITAEVVRRRALQALRTDLIAFFDRNGNGKLDAEEVVAVNGFLTGTETTTVVANPTPAEEQARLAAVAVEVDRRRALREETAKALGNARPGAAPVPLEETIRSLRASLERLEKIAAERAKAPPAGEKK